jgi:hypothetical protein
MDQAEPTNPNVFAFFKGVNAKADADGVLSTDVANGLPPGVYRLASVAAAANHQACLGPVAQRGTFDDAVYVSAPSSTNASFLLTFSHLASVHSQAREIACRPFDEVRELLASYQG